MQYLSIWTTEEKTGGLSGNEFILEFAKLTYPAMVQALG